MNVDPAEVIWHTHTRHRYVVLQSGGLGGLVALSTHYLRAAAQSKIDRIAPANPDISYTVWDTQPHRPETIGRG